jgi:hypothetical protein
MEILHKLMGMNELCQARLNVPHQLRRNQSQKMYQNQHHRHHKHHHSGLIRRNLLTPLRPECQMNCT